MAISVVTSGAGSDKTTGVISMALAAPAVAGDVIVLGTHFDNTTATMPSPPDWGGIPFSRIEPAITDLTLSRLDLWSLIVSVGAQDDINAAIDSAVGFGAGHLVIRGLSGSPADARAFAVSLVGSTTPSSGATATLAQANEIAIGFIATQGPGNDTIGTWGGGFTATARGGTTGGLAGSNRTIAPAYLIVSATTALTASKTGIVSRPWAAAIQTFQMAAAASGLPFSRASSAVGVGVGL